jgi:hypothetical protein
MRRTLARLHRDQSGNMYVLYVASALLLVAMLWAIIGVGQRLVQHETVQASADATAYAGAVLRAKGLNLIAFCNLLMAALFALLVAQKLYYFALVAAGVSVTISGVYSARILSAMNSVAALERAVAAVYPALALAEASAVGTHPEYRRHYAHGRLIAAAWPMPKHPLAIGASSADLGGLCNPANAVSASALGRIGGWPSAPNLGLLASGAICDPTQLVGALVLPDDFARARFVRGFSLLDDASVDGRRRSVGVAARGGSGASPTSAWLLMTAQAEVYSMSGAEDLWHMDWRARLVPYVPGDLTEHDAGGVLPQADVMKIVNAVDAVASSPAAAAFARDYTQH